MNDAAKRQRFAADRPVRWRRALATGALAPLAIGLLESLRLVPGFVETAYARGVYPHVQIALTWLVGFSPVAVGEVLLLLAIGAIVVRTERAFVAWRRGQRRLRNLFAHATAQMLATSGLLVLAFVLLWGSNHAREPVAMRLGLDPAPAEPSRLSRVTQRLAQRAAERRPPELDEDPFRLASDWRERVADAYDEAATQWPVFAGPRPVIRSPWTSRLMTLASTTGIYSPFTGEPNVNDHMPELLKPFTALHEVAHLRGYAREDEANFIAWWVGSRSPDPTTAYSCELNAYRIALAELFQSNALLAMTVHAAAPERVRHDVDAIRRFWRGQPALATKVLSTITNTTNDLYLKSAGHAEGVRSYGRMVDLLIAALDR